MRNALVIAACLLPLAAQAEHRLAAAVDAPPAFKAECGGCHLAFPPALLSAPDWRQVMGGLDKHYGDNASLDDKTRRQIEDFLVKNASGDRRLVGAGTPPRLTATAWFRHEHDEVPGRVVKDKRIGSLANCAACHTKADQGSFREREINVPGLGRWED